jgi:hypothetical protein
LNEILRLKFKLSRLHSVSIFALKIAGRASCATENLPDNAKDAIPTQSCRLSDWRVVEVMGITAGCQDLRA